MILQCHNHDPWNIEMAVSIILEWASSDAEHLDASEHIE